MADPPVTIERDGAVAHLVLDAPPRNEMNQRFFDAWAELVDHTLPTLDVEGLIVRGRSRHFSSGADVDELRERMTGTAGLDEQAATQRLLQGATLGFEALARLPFPAVAAISGVCLGSGLELALACHYRVCTPTAVLGLPEATFQLMPGCGGTVRLPALVGVGCAIELVLSGRRMLGPEAASLGLVDLVVDRDELRSSAAGLIQKLQ